MKKVNNLLKAILISGVLFTAYPAIAQNDATTRTEQQTNDDGDDETGKWGLAGLLGLLGLLGLKRRDDDENRRKTRTTT